MYFLAFIHEIVQWFHRTFSLENVTTWMEHGGYFMLFGLLFACGLGLPLPEDIPLIISGALIGTGHMHWWFAGPVAWMGIIGGDCCLYFLGRKYGLEITRVPFVGKHLTKERIERAEVLFGKYGVWVVAVGRLFAGIRGAMVVAAGATKFSFVKFIIADGLAAIVSGGLFMLLGFWFGSNLEKVREWIHTGGTWLLIGVIVVLAVGGYIWWRRKKHTTITDVALKKTAEKVAGTSPTSELPPAAQ